MKTHHENQIGILNDLVKINLDRVEGYEKAIKDSEAGSSLISTFRDMESQSNRIVTKLTEKVTSLGGEASKDTTVSGKIYRAWMEVRSAVNNDKKSILDLCEFGEDAAQKAYDMALNKENELDAEITQLITEQKADLRKSHDLIKSLRDSAKAAKQ